MIKWCKIIEVLDNQVLFFMEPGEEGTETLHQMVRIRGICSDIVVKNIPSELVDIAFESINEQVAEQVVKQVEDLLEKDK